MLVNAEDMVSFEVRQAQSEGRRLDQEHDS